MSTATSKTIVITGASDGIGAAAARKLHGDGHRVVVVGRSPQKTEAVARELGVGFHVADFARLDDVRELAAVLDTTYERIDVLANNAGGIFGGHQKTPDGFEQTLQINHLAPFLLTQMLAAKLIASKATVIQTSSNSARQSGKIVLDDLEHDRDFSPLRAYGTAKLANILFTAELDRRYGPQGLSAVAFHPGAIATSFGTQSDGFMGYLARNPVVRRTLLTTPEKGAAQLVWFAETTPGSDWKPGAYYEKFRPATRVHPQVRDATLARDLWDRSEAVVQRA